MRAKLTRVGGQYRPICAATGGAVMPLGIEAIDRTLPGGGLPCGGLHELCGEMAASGFAAGLLGRFSAFGPVIWILPGHGLYAPGLEAFGLPWERLFVVTAQTRDARLWALEETLRTPGVAAALGEIDRLTLTQSRRLQLAAEAGGATGFLLCPPSTGDQPSAALTRWRIDQVGSASQTAGKAGRASATARSWPPCRWRVELVRSRHGSSGLWDVVRAHERDNEEDGHGLTGAVTLAALSRDRSDQARSMRG